MELTVVFLGLSCDMLFVVASIGSDGLLGTEALQSCLPHQLDLQMGKLWAEGRATLQLHQQKPIPKVEALLMTAVVLPPDSEIVAPFAVSGGRLGPCALVEPSKRTGDWADYIGSRDTDIGRSAGPLWTSHIGTGRTLNGTDLCQRNVALGSD